MTVCGAGTLQFKTGPGPYSMSSEDLDQLNLQPGLNQGRYICPELAEIIQFNVFLYEEDQKLVVTDIDGTITESDVKVRSSLPIYHLIFSLNQGSSASSYWYNCST